MAKEAAPSDIGTASAVDTVSDTSALPDPNASSAVGTVLTAGPTPKHSQLRSILLAHLGDAWQPGSAIPSERELMATYGVSRATVREAVRQLVEEGRLDRVPGKGTFVTAQRIESSLHLASFTGDMLARGLVPTTVVLRAELAPAPVPVRLALGLGFGSEAEPVWQLDRLRLADDIPMALERGYYDARLAPDLGSQDLTGSLYSLLAEIYGLRIDRAEQTVWAEAADPQLAAALGLTTGAPVLVFQRTSTANDRPVEHVTSWYRGDRYQIQMPLLGP